MGDIVLKLESVSRIFGSTRAVDQISLEINAGEVFTLLGPSGCGKTTTLRLVAGLERPNDGEIRVRDSLVASVSRRVFVPPHRRRRGMVFQSYAIWPHMNVFENVSYPLRVRHMKRSALREHVERALSLVGLQGLEDRPAPLLSGGQQQRVALARALVYEPEILLLDEPFSNLDSKLREQMRVEVKQLQRRLGITVLFVTHDQTEALSLSNRIAVMELGKAVQIGHPKELYEAPRVPFVRDFVGKLLTLPGRVAAVHEGRQWMVSVNGGSGTIIAGNSPVAEPEEDSEVEVAIRPEDVVTFDEADGRPNCLAGVIETLLFVGDHYECHMRIGEDPVTVALPRDTRRREGDGLALHLPKEAVSIWPRR